MESAEKTDCIDTKPADVGRRKRRSLFSVLDEAANGSYFYQGYEEYENFLRQEKSKWNKLAKDGANMFLKQVPPQKVLLDSENIQKKVSTFAFDPDTFLTHQEEFLDKVNRFLKRYEEAEKQKIEINLATEFLMDDITIRMMEKAKYSN
ncbi:hypothetical protein DMENIID0001_139670 [Sergentomyia squamirostris]